MAIKVIPNGIPLDRFHFHRREISTNSTVTIGMAARFSDQKDQDCLVRALARLPRNFELELAGDGPRLDGIKRQATEMKVADRVQFWGAIDWVPDFLDRLDIYVQSSRWEGFGLSAVEAMASGLPTIASNVPGLANIIDAPELLFPPSEDAILSERITSLCEQPQCKKSLSDLMLSKAQRYSIEQCLSSHVRAYKEVSGV